MRKRVVFAFSTIIDSNVSFFYLHDISLLNAGPMDYINFVIYLLKFLVHLTLQFLFNLAVHILMCFALFGNARFCTNPSKVS